VSHLGLSTHSEKVQEIMELATPRTSLDLQKFLGMVVYFSSYIPFYSFIAAPLFNLLKKGCKWVWRVEHDITFEQLKQALAGAPVLGHLNSGHPYCLYMDASDYAIGASLQQVQLIAIRDLRGTPAHDRLWKAWESSKPPPLLMPSLLKEI
jgi:hypothetical protein